MAAHEAIALRDSPMPGKHRIPLRIRGERGTELHFARPRTALVKRCMLLCQFCAACARSFSVIATCTSFSAWAKVAGETSGPTGGAVPNAGGAPGVGSVGIGLSATAGACPLVTAAEPSIESEEVIRNARREFAMCSPESGHCSGPHALRRAGIYDGGRVVAGR